MLRLLSPNPVQDGEPSNNPLYGKEIPENIVYIDLLPSDSSTEKHEDSNNMSKSSWSSSRIQVAEERSWIERGHKVIRTSKHPRHVTEIDPTITVLSRTAVTSRSYYTVHTTDGVIFSESTVLEPLDESTCTTNDSLLYKTSLVPGFWNTIVNSSGKYSSAL